MDDSQQSSDFLSDVQFKALNALYIGYHDAYFLRAEKLGTHKT